MNVARLRLAPVGETVFPPAYGLQYEECYRVAAPPHTPLHLLMRRGA